MYRQRYPDDPGMHNTGGRGYNTRIERAPTFCDNIRSGLCISIIGLLLVPAAVFLLGWNEGRAVQTAKSLEEGFSSVTELHSSSAVEPLLNGKLIHISEKISCNEILSDSVHGIAVGAVALKRHVEMYQWVEIQHRDERELPNGDKEVTTTYSYDTSWRADVVRSSSFDNSVLYRNPDRMPFSSETYQSSRVMLGEFTLSPKLRDGINKYTDLIPAVVPSNSPEIKLLGKYMYYSHNPGHPEVGDVRVSFSYSGLCKDSKLGPAQMVSVMAMQDGFTLTGYQTQAGNVLEMIELSHKSAYEMIQSAQSQNTMITWLVRGVGIFINFLGFTCLTSLLRSLVSYIPVVRELVYVSSIGISLSFAVSLSLFTIAVSWIIYRPMMAFAIIGLSALFILLPGRVLPSSTRRYS